MLRNEPTPVELSPHSSSSFRLRPLPRVFALCRVPGFALPSSPRSVLFQCRVGTGSVDESPSASGVKRSSPSPAFQLPRVQSLRTASVLRNSAFQLRGVPFSRVPASPTSLVLEPLRRAKQAAVERQFERARRRLATLFVEKPKATAVSRVTVSSILSGKIMPGLFASPSREPTPKLSRTWN